MVSNIIEIRVAGKGTDVNPSSGKSSSASMGGGLVGLGAGIGALVGFASITTELLKSLLFAFEPVLSILKGIMKTLGLFLAPIAEFAIAILQPFLSFLRPIVLLFRAMMAPVMNLIRGFSNIMSSQMASEDLTGALATGSNIITLMLGGLFISFADVLGTMLIQGIGFAIESISSLFIDLVFGLFRPLLGLIPIIGDDLQAGWDVLKEDIKGGLHSSIQTGVNFATQSLHNGTQTMMEGLVNIYTDKLTTLQGEVNTIMPTVVSPITDTLTNTSASVGNTMTGLQNNTNSALTTIDSDVGTYLGNGTTSGTIPQRFNSALQVMGQDMDAFAKRAGEAGTKIRNALNNAKVSFNNLQFNLVKIG